MLIRLTFFKHTGCLRIHRPNFDITSATGNSKFYFKFYEQGTVHKSYLGVGTVDSSFQIKFTKKN